MAQKTKSRTSTTRLIAGLAVTACSVAALAADPSSGFSSQFNPSPAGWSYGYSNSLGGVFQSFNTTAATGPFAYWRNPTGPNIPLVGKNTSGSSYTSFSAVYLPGQINLHPGENGEFAVLRYTLQSTGTFNIGVTWRGQDVVGTTTDVHLFHNTTSLFSGNVNGYGHTQTTSNTISGILGDTIDVRVGRGANDYRNDTTGLEMTIVPAVPEPASMLALGIGAVGLLKRKINRKS